MCYLFIFNVLLSSHFHLTSFYIIFSLNKYNEEDKPWQRSFSFLRRGSSKYKKKHLGTNQQVWWIRKLCHKWCIVVNALSLSLHGTCLLSCTTCCTDCNFLKKNKEVKPLCCTEPLFSALNVLLLLWCIFYAFYPCFPLCYINHFI